MKKIILATAFLMLPAILIAQIQKAVTPNAASETLTPVLSGAASALQPSTMGTTEIVNDHLVISVVPNPFTKRAYIVLENCNKNNYRFVLFNSEGKVVRNAIVNEEKIWIEKKNLKAGLYFFKLIPQDKGSMLMGKFIIE